MSESLPKSFLNAARETSQPRTTPVEETLYVRDADMVFRKLADDMVLVPIRRGIGDFDSFYTLNDVGCFIWETLCVARSEDEILKAILNRFDVGKEEALRDLRDYLAQLTEIRAIGTVLRDSGGKLL